MRPIDPKLRLYDRLGRFVARAGRRGLRRALFGDNVSAAALPSVAQALRSERTAGLALAVEQVSERWPETSPPVALRRAATDRDDDKQASRAEPIERPEVRPRSVPAGHARPPRGRPLAPG